MIAIDLTKELRLDADIKTMQLNVTGSLDRPEGTTMFSLLKKQKKPF